MIDNRNSSVRDIAKLFPEEKRLGTKASDLVSGIALTVCLDIDEAFDVLGTSMSTQYQLTLRIRNGTSKHTTRVQGNKNSYMIMLMIYISMAS